jgi:hypothetical protein
MLISLMDLGPTLWPITPPTTPPTRAPTSPAETGNEIPTKNINTIMEKSFALISIVSTSLILVNIQQQMPSGDG